MMRQQLLVLSMVLAALGFLMTPAMAAGSPPAAPVLSAADHAFLASIAVPVKTPAAPERGARRRPGGGVGEKALCTATANCAFGGTVSCEGNSSSASCSATDGNCSWGEVGHVTCDGVTTSCGGSCCPENFCSHEFQCYQSCWPCNYNYTCNWNGCYDDCECQWSTCPP